MRRFLRTPTPTPAASAAAAAETGASSAEVKQKKSFGFGFGRSKEKNKGSSSFSSSSEAVSIPDSVRKDVLAAVDAGDAARLEQLLLSNPTAAEVKYAQKSKSENTQETLLSYAILVLSPLPVIEVIYQAHPSALTIGNSHGMSALHQASTVATPLNVMEFLVMSFGQCPENNGSSGRGVRSVGHLAAPGNWTIVHTACRCGALPVETFQYLLGRARRALEKKTTEKQSTPLHLAIFGLANRSVTEQRVILQNLVQAYPYAVNVKNAVGYTPLDLAQHQARKTTFPPDMVGLLMDVQSLAKRKYSTRVQVELAIDKCQAKLDEMERDEIRTNNTTNSTAATASISMASTGGGGSEHNSSSSSAHRRTASGSEHNNSTSNSAHRPAMDKQAGLRQSMLAHIEMQMLVPLRNRFPSETELREIIVQKTKERARLAALGPSHLAQTMALNEEIIQLEAKVQREVDALVPQEMQATRQALYERLQATAHMLPINNVSLQFLKVCTDNFSEANKIGKGGFGSVYRAYDPVKCAQYAIKKTDKTDDPSLLREVQVLSRVFHPNVVKLLGFYLPPGGQAPEFLVYEFGAGGTIADRVSTEENRKSLTWSIRLSAAAGIASGLNYLHYGLEDKIYHHDVKPENIVFNETLDRAILIDCGIAKVLKKGSVSFAKTMAGTPFYLPDDYTEETPYDEKCEVFSFGMVLRVLVSGKLPRSLRDRNSNLVPDPLAGKWPTDILEHFVKMTVACVSEEPDDRPTIEELYRDLQYLESKAESKMEFTEEQEECMNQTLQQSMLVSRASRKLSAFGKCDCSRHKKEGLYCPGKLHFQCTECFNKYVLDFLGEDVYCREPGCTCAEPWTLDELHHHLRRSVLCRHIESLMRNRELDAYKANNRLLNEVGRGFDRVMHGIAHLGRDELKCPLLALLIPARSERKRSVMRRAMRSWKTSTQKTFFLYFLCAHDRSLVQAPIKVNATRNWVKSAAPFLRAALAGLQIAVLAAGIPISIPFFEMHQTGDSITANLDVLDEVLMDVSGPGGVGDRDMQDLLNQMQSGDGRLSHESYRLVAAVANEPGNTLWREKMVLAERDGELAWVRVENENKWKRAPR